MMKDQILELNSDGLRRFAFTTACLLAGLFGVLLPLTRHGHWPLWPWIVAVVLILWGLFLPARLRLLYRSWMKLALLLGKINSMVLLSLLYIGLFSPLGIVMRLFGYDPLRQKYQAHAPSYRKPSTIPLHNHMEKPY